MCVGELMVRGTAVALMKAVLVVFAASVVLGLFAHAQNPPDAKTEVTRMPEVRLDGGYFSRNGKRFVPMGAHWVPAKAAMQWPVEWDPKDIEADFAKMHELGYSIVRFDMLWA